MDDTLEASWAAQKMAASTLTALRLHAKNRAEDEHLVALWDSVKWIILDNMTFVVTRRDKLLQQQSTSD